MSITIPFCRFHIVNYVLVLQRLARGYCVLCDEKQRKISSIGISNARRKLPQQTSAKKNLQQVLDKGNFKGQWGVCNRKTQGEDKVGAIIER